MRKQFESAGLGLPRDEPEAALFVPAVIEPARSIAPVGHRRTRRRRRAQEAAVELEIDRV